MEGGPKFPKIRLLMGVTFEGDATNNGKNTHLLLIMHVRLSHKNGSQLDKPDSIKKREKDGNNIGKKFTPTTKYVSSYIRVCY